MAERDRTDDSLTKSDLIEILAEDQKHLAHKDVELAVKSILEKMSAELAGGERIEIRGFGSFSLHFPRRAHGAEPEVRGRRGAARQARAPLQARQGAARARQRLPRRRRAADRRRLRTRCRTTPTSPTTVAPGPGPGPGPRTVRTGSDARARRGPTRRPAAPRRASGTEVPAVSVDTPLITALDFADAAAAESLAARLDPRTTRLKIGKQLFTLAGPALVERLQRRGFEIFLDLKFHDIPRTVGAAVAAAASLGVWMTNVHAGGGPRMLDAARDAVARAGVGTAGTRVIGVTVLDVRHRRGPGRRRHRRARGRARRAPRPARRRRGASTASCARPPSAVSCARSRRRASCS